MHDYLGGLGRDLAGKEHILKSSWALATNGEPSHNLSETSPVRGLNMAHGDGIGTTFLKQFGLSFVTLYEYVAAA